MLHIGSNNLYTVSALHRNVQTKVSSVCGTAVNVSNNGKFLVFFMVYVDIKDLIMVSMLQHNGQARISPTYSMVVNVYNALQKVILHD